MAMRQIANFFGRIVFELRDDKIYEFDFLSAKHAKVSLAPSRGPLLNPSRAVNENRLRPDNQSLVGFQLS